MLCKNKKISIEKEKVRRCKFSILIISFLLILICLPYFTNECSSIIYNTTNAADKDISYLSIYDSCFKENSHYPFSETKQNSYFDTVFSIAAIATKHVKESNLKNDYKVVILSNEDYIYLLQFINFFKKTGGIHWEKTTIKDTTINLSITIDSSIYILTKSKVYQNKDYSIDASGNVIKRISVE